MSPLNENKHINQGSIRQSLIHAGIDYVYLGKELGPFSKDPNCCVEGIVQYNLIAQTRAFRDGISRIKKDAMIYNLALMCAEKEPSECHRMILVCRHLRGKDAEIKHILADGNLEDNRDTERRLMKMLKIKDEILFDEIEDPVERAYEEMGRRNAFKHRNDTPYAKDIAEFINRRGSLPIASRRAFKRVLATIKTIALIHQRQGRRDDMGNVIADYTDYALAFQNLGDSFRESLGEGQRYTDDRMRIIDKEGQITPRSLSKKESVSTATISQWLKPMIEKGVLDWCDEKGHGFRGVADLEKAKRSGKAYLTVSGGKRLPTVFEITGDVRWDKGGELYLAYDLRLDGVEGEKAYHQDEETVIGQDVIIDFENATSNDNPGVKVLSEKSHAEILKMVDDFRKKQQAIDPNSAVSINFSNEFAEILSQGPFGLVN